MEKKRKKEKQKRKNENPAYLDIFRVISFRDEVFVQKFLHENIITQEYYIHKSIKSRRKEGEKKAQVEYIFSR